MGAYNFTDEDRLRAVEEKKKARLNEKAIRKLLAMSPKERDAYVPENGYEELVKLAMANAQANPRMAITVHKEFRDTMGERIGSNWKDTQRKSEDKPDIIVDLPRPKRTKEDLTN